MNRQSSGHGPEGVPPALSSALEPTYRLLRGLGSGGMAVVYLAHDGKHERDVAIKVLRDELAATVGAERFLREIRVVARLTHPNILPVLDSGDVAGVPYYVMPFIAGDSLRAMLERSGPIPIDEAVVIASEVADALHYAHAAGIVHRDIKPENILMLGGHAMVTDFGIARAVSLSGGADSVTSAGMILGTPAYMSPEQAAGDAEVDGRSDVYALATVLFEMVSGATPFKAETAQKLIARRFVEAPARLSSLRADVPSHIDEAVAAALSMEPVDRPATAAEFARRLADPSRSGRMSAAVRQPSGEPEKRSIAVLPFVNLTSDPENDFLSDGLTEEIIGALARLRTLRVAARGSSFAFKGRREDVRTIARKLGVSTVLDGSVRRSGSRIRVSAQLVDATSGFELWSEQLDRTFDDAFEIQTHVAQAIAAALKATLLDPGMTTPTGGVNGAAYETYLRGRYALNKRTETELERAVTLFRTAAEQDADFALARAGLAEALLLQAVYGAKAPKETMPETRAAAEEALRLDPSLPEAHSTLGAVAALYDRSRTMAEDHFRRAIALNPRDSAAHQRFAMHCLVPARRFDEARAEIEQARSLDALSMVIATSVGVVQHLAGDAAGAVRTLRQALELDPSFGMAYYFIGGALRDAGDLAGSVEAYRTAMARSGGGTPEMTCGLAVTLAQLGDRDAATSLRRELAEAAERRHVSPCLFAQVDGALGAIDAGLAAIERAAEERDPEVVYIGVRPSYEPLRSHPRFAAVLERIDE